MKTHGRVLLLVLAAVFFFSCESQTKSQRSKTEPSSSTSFEQSFTEKLWLLVGHRTDNVYIHLEPGHGSAANIYFYKDGTCKGNTGTNLFSGKWTAKKSPSNTITPIEITITQITKKAASNEIAAKFEQEFLHNLSQVRGCAFVDSTILFSNEKNNPLLRFLYQP